MKNKPLTYLLIVSVAAVWGIIFYRLFAASGDEESSFKPLVQSKVINESLDDYKLKDTFTLALNYRDPFLGKTDQPIPASATNIQVSSLTSSFSVPKPIKPPVNWEVIKYTGFILNPLGKRVVAIMTINGKEHMLSEGQSADGVKLLKNFKDSVKVFYQDKTKNIRLQ